MSIAADHILKGQKIIQTLRQELHGKFLLGNKSLSEWKNHFTVEVPAELNTTTGLEINLKLLSLWQEASFYHSVANIKLQLMKNGCEQAIRDEYFQLVENYKSQGGKPPAAATLEALAKNQHTDTISALTLAQLEKDFWKDIVTQLRGVRKLLENSTMNIAIDQKMEKDRI